MKITTPEGTIENYYRIVIQFGGGELTLDDEYLTIGNLRRPVAKDEAEALDKILCLITKRFKPSILEAK